MPVPPLPVPPLPVPLLPVPLLPVLLLPVLLLLVLLAPLLPLAVATPAARAEPRQTVVESPVAVLLSDVTPAVLLAATTATGSTDTLQVRGTLVNHGLTDLRTVAVRLRLSPTPVASRAEVARIATGQELREGDILWTTQLALTSLLPAGAAIPFELTVPVASLRLPTSAGVAVVSVEALGDLVQGDGIGAEQVGLTTTFLPWFPQPDAVAPTGVVWLWPLTDLPARTGAGTLLTDDLGAAVSPGGRLRTLLDLALASTVPLTLLLDPALLEAVQHMASPNGYTVSSGSPGSPGSLDSSAGSGQPVDPTSSVPEGATSRAGTAGAAAAAWLRDLGTVLARPGYQSAALPYALPDVVALHRADRDLDITRAVTDAAARVEAVTGRPVTVTMTWPADGVTDAGSLDVLAATGAQAVLLSDRTLPTETAAGTTDGIAPLTPGSRLTAVLADHRIARVLATPTETAADSVLARQRLLADLAQVSVESNGRPPTLVAAPPPLWDPDPTLARAWLSALATSPFARAVPLHELLDLPAASEPTPERALAEYRRRDRRAELGQHYLGRVADQRAHVAAFRGIVSNTTDSRARGIEDALTRAESLLWRTDAAGARALLTAVTAEVTDLVSQVRVVSRGTTTFPGDQGVVPVVVANDLDQPVRVGLTLAGTPAIRFTAERVEPFTVAAHTKRSVEVPARIVGSGDIAVQVQLTTAEGASYGTPAALVVRSTAYARAAGWVVGGLLALLVALLAVNFVRRRRGPRPPATGANEPAPVPGQART